MVLINIDLTVDGGSALHLHKVEVMCMSCRSSTSDCHSGLQIVDQYE